MRVPLAATAVAVALGCRDLPAPESKRLQLAAIVQLPEVVPQQQREIVFGPRRFERPAGKPTSATVDVEIDDFAHYEPTFVLYAQSGDDDGRRRVSAAIVALNGTPVFRQSDFSQRKTVVSAAVEPSEHFTLTVTVFSEAGNRQCQSRQSEGDFKLQRKESSVEFEALAGSSAVSASDTNCAATLTVWLEGQLRPGRGRVGSAGGIVTSGDQHVTLIVPPDALEQSTLISIDSSPTGLPASPAVVPGTMYSLRPDGQTFRHPVTLSIKFDPSVIPQGARLADITLHTVVEGRWREAAFSVQNDGQVSGQITSFSPWGLANGGQPSDIGADCQPTSVQVGRSVECKVTPFSPSGDPQYRPADGRSNNRIVIGDRRISAGSPEQTITFRAIDPGTTTIRLFVGEIFIDVPITITDPSESGPGPFGTRVVIERSGDLWWIDPDTREATRLTQGPDDDAYAQLSPDGTELAFTSIDEVNRIFSLNVMQTTPGAVPQVLLRTLNCSVRGQLAWAPSGGSIAYQTCGGVFVVNRDGTQNRPLTQSAVGGPLAWFADGRLGWATASEFVLANLTTGEFVALSGRVSGEHVSVDMGRLRNEADAHPTAARLITSLSEGDGCEPLVELDLTSVPAIREFPDSTERCFEVLNGETPRWSPDGELFVFHHPTEDGLLLVRSDRTGSQSVLWDLRGIAFNVRVLDWGLIGGADDSRVTRTIIGVEGGTALSWDGRFRVDVPPLAVTRPETLTIGPTDLRHIRAGLTRSYPLLAIPVAQGYRVTSTVSQLDVPATVSLRLDPLVASGFGGLLVGKRGSDGTIAFPSGDVFEPESPVATSSATGEITTLTTSFSDFFAVGTDMAAAVEFVRSRGSFQSVAPERFYIDFPVDQTFGLPQRTGPVRGIVIHSFDWERKADKKIQTVLGAAIDHLFRAECVRATYFIGRTPLQSGQPDGWMLRLFADDVAPCHTRSGFARGPMFFTSDNSIGIELEQWVLPCESPTLRPGRKKVCLRDATRVWGDLTTPLPTDGDGFTNAQYATLRNLICDLADRYPTLESSDQVALHYEVDPSNKGDPRQFRWERIADLPQGCDRIVFASQRTGLPEIFSVEATQGVDVSGASAERSVRRLTGNSDAASLDDPTTRNTLPRWSPDRRRIVFSTARAAAVPFDVGGPGRIAIMNSDGTGYRQLTFDSRYSDGDPAWSPGGDSIVFNRELDLGGDRRGPPTVWVMDIRESVLLGTGPGKEPPLDSLTEGHWPDWAPNRNVIGVVRNGDLFEINPDGVGERLLCCDRLGVGFERFDYNPRNDLEYVASLNRADIVGTRVFVRTDLYLMSVDQDFDPSRGNLTPSPLDAIDLQPSFSGDGTRIAFASNRGGDARNFDIYVMSLGDGSLRRLTTHFQWDAHPSWQAQRH